MVAHIGMNCFLDVYHILCHPHTLPSIEYDEGTGVCGHAVVRGCGHVVVRGCGHAVVRGYRVCGHAVVREYRVCGHVVVRGCGHAVVRGCGHAVVRGYRVSIGGERVQGVHWW